jgi:hypothetical protein
VQEERLNNLQDKATQAVIDERINRARDELNKREALIREAEEKHTRELIRLRKIVMSEEERVRLLERRQAMRRETAGLRREALVERLRQLERGQPSAELPGRQVQKLERKLDALQRELTELRRELRRLQPEREK